MGGQMTLMRIKSELTSWSRQLTWPWLVAFALLAACTGFYLSVVVPARHSLQALSTQLDAIQHGDSESAGAPQDMRSASPEAQLDAFYKAFPTENTVPDTLEKIIKLAKTNGINPKQAEYRIVKNNPGELLSYQITLPIRGAYPKIMAFTFELLSSTPNLSVDNVSFQRQKIGDSTIEATLKMTLYIKRGLS